MSADTFTIMNILNITGNITSVTETPATHHNLMRFQYILFVYVLSVIIASGVIGNVLSIAVLSQPRMMSTTAIYLISLAVFDTFVLICTLCSFTLPMNEYFRDEVYPYIHPHVYYLALVSQMGSIYTTLAFTLERFMAVCYPMRLENNPTKSRTIKIIVLIVAFVMTYNIPRWFEFRMVPNDDNTTSVTYEVTKFGQNSSYKKGYLNCAYFLFMFGIPFLSLFCLNLRLMITIRNSRLSRRALSRTRGAHDSYLTAFLFAIVSVFFFCQLPALVDNIIWSCLSDADLSSKWYVIFTGISNTMVNVNSAVNFLFYCCVGKKFRQVFREIVCCNNAESDDTLYTTRSSARSTHSRNESSRRPCGHNAFSLKLFNHSCRDSNNKRSDELQNSAKKRANFDRKDDGELINLCDLKINGIEPNAVLLNRRSLAPKGSSGQKAAKYITMSGHEHNMDCEV